MESEKCLRALASAVFIAAAVLASSGAARASTYQVIHEFEVPKSPGGNLVMDAAGNLYGTTAYGGASCPLASYGCGVVWKLAPNRDGTWGTLTVLHEFTGGADGAFPYAGLVFDAAGNLYGTTGSGGSTACMDGCGVVFKLAPSPEGTWTERVLYTFTGGADGDGPLAGLIFDAAGDLYGTTVDGGSPACATGCGVVFKLVPNSDGTWTESVLYSFTGGADGAHPYAGLVFDAAGNLYGTTYASGTYNNGVVFKLTPNPEGTWTESILHTFTGGADGATPYAGLIFDAAGKLYGTTDLGGGGTACTSGSGHMTGCGVVFKLAPNPDGSWTESVLHTFTRGADGANPYAGLIFHAAGNLYGTTTHGGFDNNGVVFELTPTSSGWRETVLGKFLGGAKYPLAPVIFDPKGNLYGTTFSGTGNNGVVFKITP